MKKTLIVLLIAAGLCLMSSCNNTETKETEAASEDTAAAVTETAATVEETVYYTVELDNGVTLEMGAVADQIIASLGEPLSVAEAPSCVHEGNDVLYTYNGFTLTTTPDAEGNNRIQEISLTSDAVSLTNGISIGSDKTAVETAFGTDYTDNFGVLTFELEGATLAVVLDADNCISGLVITAQ